MKTNFRQPENYKRYLASRAAVIAAVNNFVSGCADSITIDKLLADLFLFEKEQFLKLYHQCAYLALREREIDGLVYHEFNDGNAIYYKHIPLANACIKDDPKSPKAREKYQEAFPLLKQSLNDYIMNLKEDESFTLQSLIQKLELPHMDEKDVAFLYKHYVSRMLYLLEKQGYLATFLVRRPMIYYKTGCSKDPPNISLPHR